VDKLEGACKGIDVVGLPSTEATQVSATEIETNASLPYTIGIDKLVKLTVTFKARGCASAYAYEDNISMKLSRPKFSIGGLAKWRDDSLTIDIKNPRLAGQFLKIFATVTLQ